LITVHSGVGLEPPTGPPYQKLLPSYLRRHLNDSVTSTFLAAAVPQYALNPNDADGDALARAFSGLLMQNGVTGAPPITPTNDNYEMNVTPARPAAPYEAGYALAANLLAYRS